MGEGTGLDLWRSPKGLGLERQNFRGGMPRPTGHWGLKTPQYSSARERICLLACTRVPFGVRTMQPGGCARMPAMALGHRSVKSGLWGVGRYLLTSLLPTPSLGSPASTATLRSCHCGPLSGHLTPEILCFHLCLTSPGKYFHVLVRL